MTLEDITTVLILVEFKDGTIRQVLYDKEMKMAILYMIANNSPEGLRVTEEIMPIKIEKKT